MRKQKYKSLCACSNSLFSLLPSTADAEMQRQEVVSVLEGPRGGRTLVYYSGTWTFTL